jgi:hypothetical protein
MLLTFKGGWLETRIAIFRSPWLKTWIAILEKQRIGTTDRNSSEGSSLEPWIAIIQKQLVKDTDFNPLKNQLIKVLSSAQSNCAKILYLPYKKDLITSKKISLVSDVNAV